MSDKDASTPRVFLIRHGETEWSRIGRYTGITDLPLLPEGEDRVRQTASVIIGAGKLIDPAKIASVICSPRKRAARTLEILLEQVGDSEARTRIEGSVETTEDIAEWGYGDYEGLHTHQIRTLRSERGLDSERPWDIWRDGCEGDGGHSPQYVAERLDRIVDRIVAIHGEVLAKKAKGDIIVVAHGHILRAFVKRWLGFSMDTHLEMMLEPGGVCGLSYAHANINERAVLVGMSFPGSG